MQIVSKIIFHICAGNAKQIMKYSAFKEEKRMRGNRSLKKGITVVLQVVSTKVNNPKIEYGYIHDI